MDKTNIFGEDRIAQYILAYQQLLEEKGYIEANLDNGSAPGTTAKNIEEAFHTILRDAGAHPEGADIVVQTFGRFGPEKKPIGFDFQFRFDPRTETIDLKGMEVYGNDFSATVINRLNSSIPSLQQMLEIIRERKSAVVYSRKQQPKQAGRKGQGLS